MGFAACARGALAVVFRRYGAAITTNWVLHLFTLLTDGCTVVSPCHRVPVLLFYTRIQCMPAGRPATNRSWTAKRNRWCLKATVRPAGAAGSGTDPFRALEQMNDDGALLVAVVVSAVHQFLTVQCHRRATWGTILIGQSDPPPPSLSYTTRCSSLENSSCCCCWCCWCECVLRFTARQG